MSVSFGMVCNFYQEENALPGLLENASQWADSITLVWAGPEGADPKQDPSVDIAEKWGVRILFDTIEEGFGPLRTRCIHAVDTEWAILCDADERLFCPQVLTCEGTESWDMNYDNRPAIHATQDGVYDQLALFRQAIEQNPTVDAMQFVRRHWFDFSMRKPTQSWHLNADWQMRCVRNRDYISYTRGMHEHIVDSRSGAMPSHWHMEPSNTRGLFLDHFHCWYKRLEPLQRQEDIRIYDALHQKFDVPPTA